MTDADRALLLMCVATTGWPDFDGKAGTPETTLAWLLGWTPERAKTAFEEARRLGYLNKTGETS